MKPVKELPDPYTFKDDDLRTDIFDDDHGTGRDWTPPHGVERPYKADDYCRRCEGAGRVRVYVDAFFGDWDLWGKCPRCKGSGHV